ncbi:hypothetical protein I552_9741 [Mycobacterium xenopi 3993]|nr:hypothetical protein I552_9741 [Mycobacterium xenopi 3993]
MTLAWVAALVAVCPQPAPQRPPHRRHGHGNEADYQQLGDGRRPRWKFPTSSTRTPRSRVNSSMHHQSAKRRFWLSRRVSQTGADLPKLTHAVSRRILVSRTSCHNSGHNFRSAHQSRSPGRSAGRPLRPSHG